MNILIVGCGLRPRKGSAVDSYVNLDKYPLSGVDIIHDLDCPIPLPFPDGMFDRVEAEDVLEHVTDIVTVVNELGRVLKIGGILWIRGPDCRYPEQGWADPTHKRLFAPRSFDGWDRTTHDGKHYGYYFHQGKIFFRIASKVDRNKGIEYTLIREAK